MEGLSKRRLEVGGERKEPEVEEGRGSMKGSTGLGSNGKRE